MYVRGKSYGAIVSIILVFIAVVVTPLTIPALKHDDLSANIISPTSDPSIKQLFHDPHIPRAPALVRITPGSHVTVSQGWIMTARAITSLVLPVQTVAAVLDTFYYEALVQLAMNTLANGPLPGNALRLSNGGVVLELRVVDAANHLTWAACEFIVARLWQDAQMGFTGQFRSEWYHPQSGTLLHISLGILQGIGVAPVGGGS